METKTTKTNQQLKELYKNFSPILKQEKTQKFSTLILTLVALSLFGVFAINPTITTIIHLQKQLSDNHFIDQKLQEKIINLNSLQTQFSSIKEDLPIILNAIPQKPTVPLLAAQLQGVAQKNQVTVERLQVFQVELSKQQNIKGHGSFGFTMDIEGSHANITKFLSSLIGFERIVSIENIALGNSKTKDILTLSLRGKAYFKP